MHIDNDIPKIDLPEDWIIGKLTKSEIGLLNLYANYPCRLKAEIFVLCLQGDLEASIDLTRYKVRPGSFITIQPGTILQIYRVEGDLEIYFMGFSSNFISQSNLNKMAVDMHYAAKDTPIIELKEKPVELLEDYFSLLLKTYNTCKPALNKHILNHLLSGVFMGVSAMYKDKVKSKTNLSKAEQISKNFNHLVMQNYTTQRSVAWYAKKLGITPAHLSTIVKQTTDKTCVEIITSMVIMDAKAQLKSTDLSIHDIAYSLNFTNMSFFGKYFKRHVGMGRWNTGTAKNKSSGPLDHFSFTHPVQPTLQQAPTGEGSRPDCLHPRYPAFIQVSSNRPPKVAGCPCLPLSEGYRWQTDGCLPSPDGRKRPMRPNPCAHCSQTAR